MPKPRTLRSISAYRAVIDRLGNFRVVHAMPNHQLVMRIGFEGMPQEGDSIMPTANGPASSFNANGRLVVRTDMPKETQSRMISTSWKDWHGQTHHGMQLRSYEVYPRELIPPPGEYLTVLRRGNGLVLSSRELSSATPEDEVVNILNVFLEIFNDLEITAANLDSPTALQVRKLTWKILPHGQYPFERAREALQEYLLRLPESDRDVATERIRSITRHQPDFLAVGVGGFSDYVVFGFSNKRRFVLESPHTGNATYIFRDEWERLASLTKREILQGNLQEARLVHNQRWSTALGTAIASP